MLQLCQLLFPSLDGKSRQMDGGRDCFVRMNLEHKGYIKLTALPAEVFWSPVSLQGSQFLMLLLQLRPNSKFCACFPFLLLAFIVLHLICVKMLRLTLGINLEVFSRHGLQDKRRPVGGGCCYWIFSISCSCWEPKIKLWSLSPYVKDRVVQLFVASGTIDLLQPISVRGVCCYVSWRSCFSCCGLCVWSCQCLRQWCISSPVWCQSVGVRL